MKKKLLVRISPNGKEILHLYSDYFSMKEHADITVTRATDIFFDNEEQTWGIKIIATGEILPLRFESRSKALEHEQKFLEGRMRSRRV